MSATLTPDQLRGRKSDAAQMVASLWREVLETSETPAADDNFFALGGDSMAMVTLEFRVQEESGVNLPPGALLAAPTLREFVALVCRELSQQDNDSPQG